MSATRPSKSGFTTYESNTRPLDVPVMIEPILENYDTHVNNFIKFLRDRLRVLLVYDGPADLRQHVLQKTVYACSVRCRPKKILKDVFPVMIGSRLDMSIRHSKQRTFEEPFDLAEKKTFPFEEPDIGPGFFIVCGFLRHLPYFYTNDPTNTHVVQKRIVRVYSYNDRDRGKELSLYVTDTKKRKCGQVVFVNNDGTETDHDPAFFHHCPFPFHATAYMNRLYRDELFDIDHLGNKVVVSPGHMFTKLFVKYLYGPLRDNDWKLVKSRTDLVCKSIENGCLLHVLSRKTLYFKETQSAGKMTNEPRESHREIGANGEVYMEKNTGCYREVPTQTYPLNPYALYVIVRQVSNKVLLTSIDSFHPSYENFLCILGIYETKNVGRTTMMVRDTIVSACDNMDPVYHDAPDREFWDALDLEPEKDSGFFVVVNEACIPVSQKSFDRIDLLELKVRFKTIECYIRGSFTIVRYKMGLIMKKFPALPFWVTPYDAPYWARLFRLDLKYSPTTSYIVDLIPFFQHTAFPKVILAINTMKNAVLATTSKYARYFMDTVSTYYEAPTSHHVILKQPEPDGISKHFALWAPRPKVAYMSFEGCTQEDCIVKRRDFRSFDTMRFYTLRLTVEADPSTWVTFHPVRGDRDPNSDLVGTLTSGESVRVVPYSMNVRCVEVDSKRYDVHFNKTPFRVLQHFLTGNKLMISLEQEHESSTGDKLCSLHGQKGVMRVREDVPLLDGETRPDIIVNAYCMFRGTAGQIIEGTELGGGRDTEFIVTPSGKRIKSNVFYADTFYFVIVYFAAEHLYSMEECSKDLVTGQGLKGRSRMGGMKLGNMELNALRGNGTAAAFAEKFHEHGDMEHVWPTIAIPKSVIVVSQDMECFKFHLECETRPSIEIKDE